MPQSFTTFSIDCLPTTTINYLTLHILYIYDIFKSIMVCNYTHNLTSDSVSCYLLPFTYKFTKCIYCFFIKMRHGRDQTQVLSHLTLIFLSCLTELF